MRLSKDGANRWTDNVFMLKSWVRPGPARPLGSLFWGVSSTSSSVRTVKTPNMLRLIQGPWRRVEKKLGGRDETAKFFKANAEIDFNNFDYME